MATWKPTAKQSAFVNAILDGNDQHAAYIAAGYSVSNMKPTTITEEACKLAANPNISAMIQRARDAAQAPSIASRERILAELATVAFAERAQGPVRDADKNVALSTMAKLAGHYRDAEKDPQQHPINITHVTVVLSHGAPETRSLAPSTPVVDAQSKVVEDNEDAAPPLGSEGC